ncbi:hypothetical protein, partial [Achromobacter xylosoxidans]|uniref:hypothetical protein n=1 Tax=Alcaligenes xylosoxydans xylosoxydans TaxID=85698 RepID=UPI0013F4C341
MVKVERPASCRVVLASRRCTGRTPRSTLVLPGALAMGKNAIAAALAAITLCAGPALAQPPKPAPVTPAAAPDKPDNVAEFDRRMNAVEDNLRKMHEQMDALRRTQDPEVRQRLLQEHGDTMQASMALMQAMRGMDGQGCCLGQPRAGGPMMGGPMMGNGARPGPPPDRGQMRRFYSGMTERQLKEHQYMMD